MPGSHTWVEQRLDKVQRHAHLLSADHAVQQQQLRELGQAAAVSVQPLCSTETSFHFRAHTSGGTGAPQGTAAACFIDAGCVQNGRLRVDARAVACSVFAAGSGRVARLAGMMDALELALPDTEDRQSATSHCQLVDGFDSAAKHLLLGDGHEGGADLLLQRAGHW